MFFKNKKIIRASTPMDVENFKLKNSIVFAPQSMFMISNSVLPIDNNKKLPEWWNNLKRGEGTLSTCSGVLDYLKLGYTMPMWADIEFFLEGDSWNHFYDLNTQQGNFGIETFDYDQVGSCPVTKKRYLEKTNFIKLITPWTIKTPKGWSCLILPVSWNSKKEYEVMPGVINTDSYHHINIVINPLIKEDFKISFQDPLIQIIPFKRKKNLKFLLGDDSVYIVLWHQSFGKLFKSIKTKGLYKKNQKKIDMEIINE